MVLIYSIYVGWPKYFKTFCHRDNIDPNELHDKSCEYNLKDLWPKMRKLPNDSDMLYVDVI